MSEFIDMLVSDYDIIQILRITYTLSDNIINLKYYIIALVWLANISLA